MRVYPLHYRLFISILCNYPLVWHPLNSYCNVISSAMVLRVGVMRAFCIWMKLRPCTKKFPRLSSFLCCLPPSEGIAFTTLATCQCRKKGPYQTLKQPVLCFLLDFPTSRMWETDFCPLCITCLLGLGAKFSGRAFICYQNRLPI